MRLHGGRCCDKGICGQVFTVVESAGEQSAQTEGGQVVECLLGTWSVLRQVSRMRNGVQQG
jgi:hypothetical protein